MKKISAFITIIMLFFCLTVLTACTVETETLSAPINLRYEKGRQEMVWDEVPFATGGYQVEVNGKVKTETMQYWYKFSDSELVTGSYTIRIRAITADTNYYEDSEWSDPYVHEVKRESGVTYRLINDGAEYEIDSIGTAKGNVIIFPNNLNDGKPITSVGERAFARANGITSITLGSNIRYIQDYAFAECDSLKSVILPEGLLSIGDYAFSACNSLTEIILPDSLFSIGNSAFMACLSLKSITIPDVVQVVSPYTFYNCRGLTTVTFGNSIHKIEAYAFYGCVSLTNITIPGFIQTIGDYAFSASGLVTLKLEEGVTNIGDCAFKDCKELVEVSLPSSIGRIGSAVFTSSKIFNNSIAEDGIVYIDGWLLNAMDKSLTNLNIQEGTVGIADKALHGMTKLENVKIADSVNHIGAYAFYDTAIWNNTTSIMVVVDNWIVGHTIDVDAEDEEDQKAAKAQVDRFTSYPMAADIKGLADQAFYKLSALARISTGGNNIVTIGRSAFYQCAKLTYSIPSTVQYIGDYAFYYCKAMGNQPLPSDITRIGDYTFYFNESLTEMVIPDTVKYIGEAAFMSTKLATITLPEGITAINNRAFYGVETDWDGVNLTIDLPESVKYIGKEAFAWSSKIDKVIMRSVEYIGEMAFYRSGGLVDIEINEGLRYIGDKAFSCTALPEVVLPNTVAHLGDYAFAGEYGWTTPALQRVVLSSAMFRIGRYAFYECRNLKTVIIPKGIRSIGDYAFAVASGLESIIIPQSVEGMGANVFFMCAKLTIMCETTIRPVNWNFYWNSRDYITEEDLANPPPDWDGFKWFGPKEQNMCPIIWGCQLSEDRSYVISFTKHTFAIYNYNEITITAPLRTGYVFMGWSLTDGGTSIDYTINNFGLTPAFNGPAIGLTLYAVWEEVVEEPDETEDPEDEPEDEIVE